MLFPYVDCWCLKRNQTPTLKDISSFSIVAQRANNFSDGSCIYNSAYCNFRRRACILICGSFYVDAHRANNSQIFWWREPYVLVFVKTSAQCKFVLQWKLHRIFLNMDFLILLLGFYVIILHYYQYHNSLREAEWANENLMMTKKKKSR